MNKKSKTRIFVNQKLTHNMLVYVKEKQHHFLKNVLRVKINDTIIIFDNQTGEWLAEVLLIKRGMPPAVSTALQILLVFPPVSKLIIPIL